MLLLVHWATYWILSFQGCDVKRPSHKAAAQNVHEIREKLNCTYFSTPLWKSEASLELLLSRKSNLSVEMRLICIQMTVRDIRCITGLAGLRALQAKVHCPIRPCPHPPVQAQRSRKKGNNSIQCFASTLFSCRIRNRKSGSFSGGKRKFSDLVNDWYPERADRFPLTRKVGKVQNSTLGRHS